MSSGFGIEPDTHSLVDWMRGCKILLGLKRLGCLLVQLGWKGRFLWVAHSEKGVL